MSNHDTTEPPSSEAFEHTIYCNRWVPYDENHRRYYRDRRCSCNAVAGVIVDVAGAGIPFGELPLTHPEDSCKKCGGVNAVWFAPDDLWNKMRDQNEPGIICPACFIQLAESRLGQQTWRIAPETSHAQATLTHVLEFLKSACEQLGNAEAAQVTIGYLQSRLGMTKPFAEIRKELKHHEQ